MTDTEPGDKIVVRGSELTDVKVDIIGSSRCYSCALRKEPDCANFSCNGLVFMTEPMYLAHLTSKLKGN